MEKDRNSKILAIMALLIGIVGLSVGFAAFSRTLTIAPSAEVKSQQGNFNVVFSKKQSAVEAGDVTPIVEGATGDNATISGLTISGLNAKFTDVGQKVTYSFYAYNNGEFDAYLKSIIYGEAEENKLRVCTPATGDNAPTGSYMNAACDAITVTVSVGESTSEVSATSSNASITGHKLTKTTGEKVTVTIEYPTGAQKVDGDFTIRFGDISLNYNSID